MGKVIELSQSAVKDLSRCDKKFFYRWMMGLAPRISGEPADFGTGFHEVMAAGERALQKGDNFLEAAHRRLDFIRYNGFEDRHLQGEVRNLALETDAWERLEDVLNFYWQHVGRLDAANEEIIAVEEPFYFELEGYVFRSTFDAVVQIKGHDRPRIRDHKTVGSVNEALAFLPLDFQMKFYQLAGYKHFGFPIEVEYNMARREVPPGFGHRSALTKSGAKSKASTDPKDYARREVLTISEHELKAFEEELRGFLRVIRRNRETEYWPRRVIKTGGEACAQCPYYGICTTSLMGGEISESLLKLTYKLSVEDTIPFQWNSNRKK